MTTLITLTRRLNDLAWEIESKQKEAENWRTAKSPYPEDLYRFGKLRDESINWVDVKKYQFKQVLKQIEEAI